MELAADLTPDGLRDVLAELGDRVAPVALATERTLPVHPALDAVFPHGGIVRGSTLACDGVGATTCALTMVTAAMADGAWLAVVDVPTFGPDAANELGVPIERIVRVDTDSAAVRADGRRGATGRPAGAGADAGADVDGRVRRWLDVMGAAVDGFDLVVAGVPPGLRGERRPAAVRSLAARVQQRGAVIVVLGAPGVLSVDVTYSAEGIWDGLGAGHGVLGRRRLHVSAVGRRQPQQIATTIDLDVAGRRLEVVGVSDGALDGDRRVGVESSSALRLAAG